MTHKRANSPDSPSLFRRKGRLAGDLRSACGACSPLSYKKASSGQTKSDTAVNDADSKTMPVKTSGPLRSDRVAQWLVAVLLAGVPFHAFLTVWGASLVGHYTVLRLWSAGLLGLIVLLAAYRVARDKAVRRVVTDDWLLRGILLYGVFMVLVGVRALLDGTVTGKALAYGLLSDGRYLAMFVAVYVLARSSRWLHGHWRGLVFVPACVVGLFACLQYLVLPTDFLTHFGYGPATIKPFETINSNAAYLRVASTLRGANPLGAYMLVVLSLVVALWLRRAAARWWLAGVGVLGTGALLFSFSRSAWVGVAIACVVLVWAVARTRAARVRVLLVLAGMMVLTGVAFVSLRHDRTVQNAIFHTEDRSTVAVSSNDQRARVMTQALRQVAAEPFGRGPGTAGPASVYNTPHPLRIAENYYLQIAQEVGWLGLLVFVIIQCTVLLRLWYCRQSPLALGLFASGVGLVAVNMLSHAWTDDTLAFLWWGLAALAIALTTQKFSGFSRK